MVIDNTGAIIEQGPTDWQIVQQNESGCADISLTGRWVSDVEGRVEVRLVHEDTGLAVSRSLDWHAAHTQSDGTWSATLVGVPAGGLYRLETRCQAGPQAANEWSLRGDVRHFIGVGDLWVVAGQSNSTGYGRGPVHDPPELGVHLFRNSERWALAAHPFHDSTDTRHPANRDGANPGHSPYLQLGRMLKRELNHPIGLVQTAMGGSPLSAWDPAERGPARLYHNMVHCVEQVGGRVKGILWYQGESDSNLDLAPTYAERFGRALQAWREALHDPDLPVVTAQINRHYAPGDVIPDRGWSMVREAQRQVARSISGVTVVPTLDLPLGDVAHTSPAGNMLLGTRMANSALATVYGRPIDYLAPDLQSARMGGGGVTIELVFAPVTSRMDNVNPGAQCFRVEDGDGVVPVDQVVYPGDATIRLILGRPIQGEARVHGCYGSQPSMAPMDIERFIPMLAFYDVPVDDK